jgi:hypothetical protein
VSDAQVCEHGTTPSHVGEAASPVSGVALNGHLALRGSGREGIEWERMG